MRAMEQQFIEGFDRYADELFRHASFRIQNRERARDLTQDTFLKAWEFSANGGEIRELRAFLFKTLKNLIIDEYRRSKSESLESLVNEEAGETIDVLVPPDETNTIEAALVRIDGAQAVEMLSELPEPYREALVLRYVNGFAPQEIATHLDLSENVVSVRLHRGLKKMRELYTQKDENNYA